jgi:8-oxo-dGTP diphosphatase
LIDVFEHLTPGLVEDHFVVLYYRCRPVTCVIDHNPAEVAEARWVHRNELTGFEMPAGASYILGKVFPELCRCES